MIGHVAIQDVTPILRSLLCARRDPDPLHDPDPLAPILQDVTPILDPTQTSALLADKRFTGRASTRSARESGKWQLWSPRIAAMMVLPRERGWADRLRLATPRSAVFPAWAGIAQHLR